MIPEFNWDKFGQAVGSAVLFLGAVLAVLRGHGSSKPPLPVYPDPEETRKCVKEAKQVLSDVKDAIDDLSQDSNRNYRLNKDDVSRVEAKIDSLTRVLDRMESNQKIDAALNKLHHHEYKRT